MDATEHRADALTGPASIRGPPSEETRAKTSPSKAAGKKENSEKTKKSTDKEMKMIHGSTPEQEAYAQLLEEGRDPLRGGS